MPQLLARLLGIEHPFDPRPGLVALLYPGSDFRDQFLAVADASIETLTAKHADLELDHIQPARVPGEYNGSLAVAVCDGLLAPETPCTVRRVIGRQIIHHDTDHLGPWIVDIDQITHAFRKVHRSAALRDLHPPPWPMGIHEDEKFHGAVATVLVVVASKLPGGQGRRSDLANQLGAALIEAATDRLGSGVSAERSSTSSMRAT